jgi:hypothetical protein
VTPPRNDVSRPKKVSFFSEYAGFDYAVTVSLNLSCNDEEYLLRTTVSVVIRLVKAEHVMQLGCLCLDAAIPNCCTASWSVVSETWDRPGAGGGCRRFERVASVLEFGLFEDCVGGRVRQRPP